jgi:hypothetical protein
MTSQASGSLQREGAEALRLMQRALELLDDCGEHAAGVHLDLAICRLQDAISSDPARTPGPPG